MIAGKQLSCLKKYLSTNVIVYVGLFMFIALPTNAAYSPVLLSKDKDTTNFFNSDSFTEGTLVTKTPFPTSRSTSIVTSTVVINASPTVKLHPIEPKVTPTPEEISNNDIYFNFSADATTFSLANAQRTPPRDILSEIDYSGGYGGSLNACRMVKFDSGKPRAEVVNITNADSDTVEWNDDLLLVSCGWQDKEHLKLSIIDPNGNILPETTQVITAGVEIEEEYASTQNWIDFPSINTPPGDYILSLSNEYYELRNVIAVRDPQQPRLYRLDDQLLLYGFAKNEKVRLFAYAEQDRDETDYLVGRLQGWQEYIMDSQGQRIVINLEAGRIGSFFAVGEYSGLVKPYPDYSTFKEIIISPYALTVRRPTELDLEKYSSIWDIAQYRDLKQPGETVYEVQVASDEKILWGFSWCAVDNAYLQSISRPFTIDFRIDDISLTYPSIDAAFLPQIFRHQQSTSSGWVCTRWSTLLSDWPTDKTVKLEINYNLSDSIFDGVETYPAGIYRQIIEVSQTNASQVQRQTSLPSKPSTEILGPLDVTKAYYQALNQGASTGDFYTAYNLLSQNQRARRSYDSLKSNYLDITSTQVEEIVLLDEYETAATVHVIVRLEFRNLRISRYDVTYHLVKEDGQWRLDRSSIKQLPY
ncbi:MAG: hypothetical protein ACOYNY_41135 [Caldilineaceae bacterium]